MIRVCSGFAPSGYKEYGRDFLINFAKHWPKEIELTVYTERPVDMPRGECRSLWDCLGAADFIERHRRDPEKCGTKPNGKWHPRYIGRPYNFRMDAVKFFKQCLIPEAAALDMADGDTLIWLDGDVQTFADVSGDLVTKLLGQSDIVFLGRQGSHSELGFWAVRLNARTREFLTLFADLWRSDRVFDLNEWHSAFVFDHCRSKIAMKENNLTPGGRGHVFAVSPLKDWLDHCKGIQRKALGYSPERNAAQ